MGEARKVVNAILKIYGPRSLYAARSPGELPVRAIRDDLWNTGAWRLFPDMTSLSKDGRELVAFALQCKGGSHHIVFEYGLIKALHDDFSDRLGQLS